MRRAFPVVLTILLVLAGCRAKERFDKKFEALNAERAQAMRDAAARNKYDPPKDGKLTDAQVQMYLNVRRRAKDIERVARQDAQERAAAVDEARRKQGVSGMIAGAKVFKTLDYLFTAEIRALTDLGIRTHEYDWVQAQILKASTAARGEIEVSHAHVKKSYDEAKDDQTRMMYGQEVSAYERTLKDVDAQTQDDPAIDYNRQLLSKYENELNAIAAEAGSAKRSENGENRDPH